MDKTRVSVVIVNYNVKDLLLTCLRTLFTHHDSSNLEVIVVDNDSKDGSCEAIAKAFPRVILIENKDNAGFPKANNQGFEVATGAYIFMLNPDTEFLDAAIDKLVAFMENSPEVMLAAPKLLNTDRTLQQSFWRFPTLKSVFFELHYLQRLNTTKNYADKDHNQAFDAESFSGAAIFFRRRILDQIGGLDESMFWIEDVEFCYRAYVNRMRSVYYPEAQIVHHIGQSAKKNYNISLSNQIFNKIKFFRKHRSWISWKLVTAMSVCHVCGKLILFGVLAPFNTMYYRKWKAYAYTFPKVFNPPQGIA